MLADACCQKPHCFSMTLEQRSFVNAHRLWEGTVHWKRSAAAALVFAELGQTITSSPQLAASSKAEDFRYFQGCTRNNAGHLCRKPLEQCIAETHCYSKTSPQCRNAFLLSQTFLSLEFRCKDDVSGLKIDVSGLRRALCCHCMQSLKLLPRAAILCGHSCSSSAFCSPASRYEAKQQVMPQPVLSCLPFVVLELWH